MVNEGIMRERRLELWGCSVISNEKAFLKHNSKSKVKIFSLKRINTHTVIE